MSTASLRAELRALRRALPATSQRHNASAAAAQLSAADWLQRSRCVALYTASDGELDPQPLLADCLRRGVTCLLPVVGAAHTLQWARYRADSALVANRYGILEPAEPRHCQPLADCDVVVVPLVGFDRSGQRIGMGGGYYDRALAALSATTITVGLAHSGQEVAKITPQAWDIPLHYIATERELICAKPR